MPESDDMATWRRIVAAVSDEYRSLPPAERAWIDGRVVVIESLQEELHALFEKAGGAQLCHGCGGACCARGKHHVTLVNLLATLRTGDLPPEPDFGSTCPFLRREGCLLETSRRPFNCVTFICELIEDRLEASEREAFYRLEKQLRSCYEEFEARYAGAGLRGLLLRAERLGDTPFLCALPLDIDS